MSKKTKKEKILAAYRKKLRLIEEKNNRQFNKQLNKNEKIQPKSTNNDSEITSKIIAPQNDSISKYFFADFKKSLILIVVIIALEIGLYFAKLIK